ncbi:MAG: hypothetical protein HWQ43_15810 [Nostoc sp. JL31]|uniref:hypothetical protein n=1 Tax=Nostoc sp. JL31 TaxID=2815395 RepID=UPI0025F9826E|nr:hypothetical protein [Nostoc sp. JL31]MBN3890556.1 hypothetical protein [Nostoc sp. JL31]
MAGFIPIRLVSAKNLKLCNSAASLEDILRQVWEESESKCDLQTIRSKAQELLTQPEEFLKQVTINNGDVKPTKSARKRVNKNIYTKSTDVEHREDSSYPNNVDENKLETLTNVLYKIHKQTQDILTRCTVAYLIKNHNKISEVEEDVQKLKKRRNDKKVEIKRLDNQIQDNRLPSGRDITGERYSEAFNNLMNQVPKDNK